MSQPTTVDLLIVGGGPAGIAAAARAKELGLSTLVLDADDLMRRIRDYSKDKLILPGFGGGDRMPFPDGGDWIGRLPFEPIDKDDLVARWKQLCQEARVPVRVGVELTGLEDGPADERGPSMVAKVYDHRQRAEGVYRARHVALALGRGVPRRFDIPGQTESIPLRLDDPADYVGRPACVIGGGTSAAEAVIAISNAKAAAGDGTAVIWSYRGDRLPRVSKALAEVFFEAYVGNGNIHYRPLSEPLMVVTGDDRQPYLAIRIDRRHMPDRPAESLVLELPTECCVACIGEDLPEAFLGGLGITMAVGGGRGRKRMVVNRLLESQRPRVYLIGDILSQAYLEAEDFSADPSTFREIRHRGNIKSALHDGVRVAEVVKQRLDGVADAEISVPEVEEMPAPAGTPNLGAAAGTGTSSPAGQAKPGEASVGQASPGEASPSQASPTGGEPLLGVGSPSAEAGASGWLVHLLPGGVDGDEHALQVGSSISLGRRGTDLAFPDDGLLADRHAVLTFDGEAAVLRDEGAENGVFLQVPSRRKLELRPGDLLRAGRQFLLVQADENGFSLVHYRADGSQAGHHRLSEGTRVLGRRADITLDPRDGSLSRRQLAVTVEGERLLVKDLLSANGSYLRVVESRRLEHGDRFLIGQQRFAFSTSRDAVFDQRGPSTTTGRFSTSALVAAADRRSSDPSPASAAGSAAPLPAAASGPSVTFQPAGQVCPAGPGQTILDVAEAHGIRLAAECRSGVCGSDPVRIVSGREHLAAAPGDGETETLEDLCGLEAGPCRLACMAQVRGPVVVEVIE